MPTPFQKNLVWSTAAHLGILSLLALALGFSKPEKKAETIQWIDTSLTLPSPDPSPGQAVESSPLHPSDPVPQEPPTPPQSEPPAPTPPPAIETPPAASPVHDPIVPSKPNEPKPDPIKKSPVKSISPPPIKKPNPPKPSTPQIKVSTTPMVRPVVPPLTVRNSKPSTSPADTDTGFDPHRFAKALSDKLSGTVILKGQSGSGRPNHDDFNPYLSHVMQEMYGAWRPPPGQDVVKPSSIVIRIDKNGTITKVSLATSCGKRLMDDSALAAAHSVKKLKPLPKGLGPDFEDITVNFKVQQP